MALVTDSIIGLIGWLEATAESAPAAPESRTWCVLSLADLEPNTIKDYFDNTDPNDQFAAEYSAGKLTNNPVAYLQQDSDLIYAFQKSFLMRHQGRLATYRDACEQQDYRIPNALNLAMAKYQFAKENA